MYFVVQTESQFVKSPEGRTASAISIIFCRPVAHFSCQSQSLKADRLRGPESVNL